MQQQLLFRMLEKQLLDYETQLATLDACWPTYPEGHLRKKNRNGNRCFMRRLTLNGQRMDLRIHLHTKDGQSLLRELLEKRAVFHGRPVLRRNIRALRNALAQLQVYDPEQYVLPLTHQTLAEKAAEELPPILPDRVFLPGQLNAGRWIADTEAGRFETNPYYPENRKHESRAGSWLRSKSEAFWDDELTEAGLLFRYDSAIRLKGRRVIYADFVVLHPSENRLVIIEHFGKMDDPDYAVKSIHRLQDYADNGYVLGHDLFFTTETKASPLTRSQIRATMRRAGLLS